MKRLARKMAPCFLGVGVGVSGCQYLKRKVASTDASSASDPAFGASTVAAVAATPVDWPSDGGWQPSDFVALFPIPFADLSNLPVAEVSLPDGSKAKDRGQGALEAALEKTTLPLSAFLEASTYEALMRAAAGDYAGAKPDEEDAKANPIVFEVKEKRGEDIARIPLASWRVVAARFTPCALTVPLPPALAGAPSVRYGTLGTALCRPQVRLVAQPLGTRRVIVSTSPPKTGFAAVSDDKTLHLVFTHHGGLDAALAAQVDAAQDDLRARLETAAKAGDLSLAKAEALVEASHSADALRGLATARTQFLSRVRGVRRGAWPVESLAIPGAQASLPTLLKFLKESLAQEASLVNVAQAFATSGLAPDTAEQWVFAHYAFARGAPPLVFVKGTQAFLAPADADATAWRRIGLGRNEAFLPTLRSVDALDARLLDALAADPLLSAWALGGATPRFPHRRLALRGESGAVESDTLERRTQAGVSSADVPLLDAFRKSMTHALAHTNNPRATNLFSSPCTGCHMADVSREALGLSNVGESVLAGNRPAVNLGRSHVDTSFGWNLRQLGYFETAPSLGARLLREVDVDVALARVWLP